MAFGGLPVTAEPIGLKAVKEPWVFGVRRSEAVFHRDAVLVHLHDSSSGVGT